MRMRNFWLKQEEELAGEGVAGGASSAAIVTENASALSDPADPSTEDDVNWTGIADEFDQEDAGLTVEGADEVVVEPVVKAPAAPAEAPAAAAPVVPDTPAVPVVPAVPAPAAPQASQEEYQTWKTGRLTELERTYALNEDDATAMITEPETVLPKLAARMHMEVLESSMRAMQVMVPVMMQQMNQHTEVEGRAKNLFTSINPDLASPQFEPAIMQLGQVYRNVNSTASPEEAARAIGALVRSALNMTAPVTGGNPPPAAPARPVAPAPFTPARGSGGMGAAPAPSNPFEAMALEFMQDE